MQRTAYTVGIGIEEFWRISMRELDLYVRVWNDQSIERQKAQFAIAAAVTAEIVNMLGAVNSKKSRWKVIPPTAFYEAWTGSNRPSVEQKDEGDLNERTERVLARLKAAQARKRFQRQ